MDHEDLLRAGARRWTAAEEASHREAKAELAGFRRQREEYRRLTAEGVALLDRFLAKMRRAGNPGLRRSSLLGRRCWDGWLSPTGRARVSRSGHPTTDENTTWDKREVWMRRWMTGSRMVANYSGTLGDDYVACPDPTKLNWLGEKLGELLAKNGVRI